MKALKILAETRKEKFVLIDYDHGQNVEWVYDLDLYCDLWQCIYNVYTTVPEVSYTILTEQFSHCYGKTANCNNRYSFVFQFLIEGAKGGYLTSNSVLFENLRFHPLLSVCFRFTVDCLFFISFLVDPFLVLRCDRPNSIFGAWSDLWFVQTWLFSTALYSSVYANITHCFGQHTPVWFRPYGEKFWAYLHVRYK